jgi:hypothetical protein
MTKGLKRLCVQFPFVGSSQIAPLNQVVWRGFLFVFIHPSVHTNTDCCGDCRRNKGQR